MTARGSHPESRGIIPRADLRGICNQKKDSSLKRGSDPRDPGYKENEG
jgi:hypothetical protein